ncbi:hypothetical protein EV1_038573 [Malus domestica]
MTNACSRSSGKLKQTSKIASHPSYSSSQRGTAPSRISVHFDGSKLWFRPVQTWTLFRLEIIGDQLIFALETQGQSLLAL